MVAHTQARINRLFRQGHLKESSHSQQSVHSQLQQLLPLHFGQGLTVICAVMHCVEGSGCWVTLLVGKAARFEVCVQLNMKSADTAVALLFSSVKQL
jgi:hypothetical protein